MLVVNTLIKRKHSNKSFDYFKGAREHAIKMIHICTFCFEFSPRGVWYVRTFLLHM
jgi:hypothetical protein